MIKRIFAPGSEWIYAKIYSGPKTLEKILINEILPLVLSFYCKKEIEKFFFIRYYDNADHLRVRFKLSGPEQLLNVQCQLSKTLESLLDKRLIWNFSFDTYKRELERYGVENIEHCETIFAISSIRILQQLVNDPEQTERWLWGGYSLNLLFDKFGMDLKRKVEFTEKMVTNYSGEYNLHKNSIISLNNKFRSYSKLIIESFDWKLDTKKQQELSALEAAYDDAVLAIKKSHKSDIFPIEFYSLLGSLVHMHLNRLFSTKQRQNEFVLCYLLNKAYKSLMARQS